MPHRKRLYLTLHCNSLLVLIYLWNSKGIIKEIHKMIEKNGNDKKYEYVLNYGFYIPIDWHMSNIKSEGDYVIIIHPMSVSIIKIEIIYDTHD